MTTYNTGNPLGSAKPKDLFDNAENLDRAVNDTSSREWTDRLGRKRVTMHAVETAVPDAISARVGAEAARDAAVLARDASFVSANVYTTIAEGRDTVADGGQFQVVSGDEIIRYRRDSATAQTEVARYPSSKYVLSVSGKVDAVSDRVDVLDKAVHYNPSTVETPLVIFADENNNAVVTITESGEIKTPESEQSINVRIRDLEKGSADLNAGAESLFSVTDNESRSLLSIDSNLELHLADADRTLQASMTSNYIFRAMRYDRAGDAIKSAYWYDVAENEFKAPINMQSLVALHDTDGSIQRIPAFTKVKDGQLLCIWQQIRRPNSGDGEGVRLVQAHIDYDLNNRSISVGPLSVFDEPIGWLDLTGASMHPHLITLPSGKIICVFAHQDSPDGKILNDDRNIYMKTSTDGGLTWTPKVKIISATGSIPRTMTPGTTGDFVRIPNGPNEGRIIFPVYGRLEGNFVEHAAYSDDDGVTWTLTAHIPTPGVSPNENSIALRADGSLIMNFRVEPSGSTFPQMPYATSNDDGATWAYVSVREDWPTNNCASSMVLSSTNPDDGFPKLLWSGLDNIDNNVRRGLCIRVSHDGGLTYQTQYKTISNVMSGYSNIKMIAPDVAAVFWENGFNSTNSIYMYIVNLAEIYKNGTNH